MNPTFVEVERNVWVNVSHVLYVTSNPDKLGQSIITMRSQSYGGHIARLPVSTDVAEVMRRINKAL